MHWWRHYYLGCGGIVCIKEPQSKGEGRRGAPMKLCTQEMSPCTVTERSRHPLPLAGSRQATPFLCSHWVSCEVFGLWRASKMPWIFLWSVAWSALCATGFRKWLKHTNVLPPCVCVCVCGGEEGVGGTSQSIPLAGGWLQLRDHIFLPLQLLSTEHWCVIDTSRETSLNLIQAQIVLCLCLPTGLIHSLNVALCVTMALCRACLHEWGTWDHHHNSLKAVSLSWSPHSHAWCTHILFLPPSPHFLHCTSLPSTPPHPPTNQGYCPSYFATLGMTKSSWKHTLKNPDM